ncbi:MAG: VWA domain-containing protein [Cyclobacteriaceae bacterium]
MGLDLDEWAFGIIAKYLKKKRKRTASKQPQLVELETLKPRLTLLARAISGISISLYPAEQEGGYKDHNFFLPRSSSIFPTWEMNLQFYLFRTAYLCTQQRLGLNWEKEEDDLIRSRSMAVASAPVVLESLFEEFEMLKKIYEQFLLHFMQMEEQGLSLEKFWLYGKWMYGKYELQLEKRMPDFNGQGKRPGYQDPQTVIQAKAVEEIKRLSLDKKQQEDYVLLHNFEKVETAEEFNGVWRDFDGKDDLAAHKDALDELRMNFTIRVDEPVHAVYQADFLENLTVSESSDASSTGSSFLYDEWDFKKRAYKPGFCKVYTRTRQKSDKAYYNRTITKYASTLAGLRKMLTSVNNKRKQLRRQRQGDAFDLDALIDFYTDLHTRKTPSESIYLSQRKREKDLSLVLLLDISLSSDGYVANNRVIDVEKEVSILFGEILNEFQIDFAIDGFYSKTRNAASYISLKDFHEPWEQSKGMIGAAEPQGYTRIGAAIRHAGMRLDQRPGSNKWVVLLSDGKPNDYDKYEGNYGIQDTKQALRELHERNIHTYALAIEAQARYYLPQMFGHNQYQILSRPEELLHSLVYLYERIKK